MTEADARDRVGHIVGAVALARIEQFVARVLVENRRQNLISRGTEGQIWLRHVLDSTQLLSLVDQPECWIDIGTGGGFPGVIVACTARFRAVLVEPRTLRADFLASVVDELGLAGSATVKRTKIEQVSDQADVISARAVASVDKLLLGAQSCANETTRWLLPRGALGAQEVIELSRRHRSMTFHVKHSLTSEHASILIGQGCPS